MLAAFGFATIAVFLTAIMTKRVSVLVALVLIPQNGKAYLAAAY